MASGDLDDLTKVRKQSEEGMSVGPKITKDSSKGIDQVEEQIQKLSQYLTTTMQMVAQIKSSISEFISSKDPELLTELPRQSTTSLDILSKSYNLLDRIKNTYTETNRDKEQLMFNLNSQKLEMNKFADYEQQLAEENYELVNRLGLFEQELRAMEDKVANAERIKEEAVINTEQLSSLLVDKAKEIQNLTKEKNDLNIFCKNLEQNIKLLEDLADNQKEDLLKDKQLTSNLEESNNQLQIYKEGFKVKKEEAEKLELLVNSLESQVKTLKIDLSNEQNFGVGMKKEIKELKDKIAELETMKKEYINGLGVSKLGISTLNFSRMFQHDPAGLSEQPSAPVSTFGNKAFPTVTVPVSRLVSNRESIVLGKDSSSKQPKAVASKAPSIVPSSKSPTKPSMPPNNMFNLSRDDVPKGKPTNLNDSFDMDESAPTSIVITAPKLSNPTTDSQVNIFAVPDDSAKPDNMKVQATPAITVKPPGGDNVQANLTQGTTNGISRNPTPQDKNALSPASPASQPKKPTAPVRESLSNPYFTRMSARMSLNPREVSIRVRDSRVSQVLRAVGGMDTPNGVELDLKQDYLNMLSSNTVVTQLRDLGDDVDDGKCYSDHVFLFDKSFKKNRFIIVITQYSISFFNCKKTRLLKLYLLKSLKGVTISHSNFTLCVLSFANQADVLMESYRRLAIICYLNQIVKLAELPKLAIFIRKRFIIKTDVKQQIPDKIEVSDPNNKISMPYLQDTIRNSVKSGYLTKHSKQWYGATALKNYFCLLTTIGFIYFKKYGVDFS